MPSKIDHEMQYEFSVNDEVISADLDVWARWEVAPAEGITEFIIYLQKPDTTNVELYNHQYTAGASGEANVLSDEDIKAHLDQYGTYKLRLLCGVKASDALALSYGWYDNISLDIKIKKKKVVFEQLTSVEDPQRKSSIDKLEGVTLSESLAKKNVKSILESLSLSEVASRIIKKSVSEVLSLVEHYLETGHIISESLSLGESYSAKLFKELSSMLSFAETLSGKRTVGNVITNYEITDLTAWDEVSKVTTKWDKLKTIIN